MSLKTNTVSPSVTLLVQLKRKAPFGCNWPVLGCDVGSTCTLSQNAILNCDEQLILLFFLFRHEYAVAEKNTVIATCRKLEEQLEDRAKQIQQ